MFLINQIAAIFCFIAFSSHYSSSYSAQGAEIGLKFSQSQQNKNDLRILHEDNYKQKELQTNNTINVECGSIQNGRFYFPVESNSPNGLINLYFTQYNSRRGLPATTTTYHDLLNHQQNVPRVDSFRKYPCSGLVDASVQKDCSKTYKMTQAQMDKSGYTAFDRGHMTPVNPYRFHADAVSNTFYCVNIAPQEPYTNQNPWATVEDRVHRQTTAGFVMTGLCEGDGPDGVTIDGVQVPACFWKLLCYKEGSQTIVVGFIGENALFNKSNETAKQTRKTETLKARSQQEIINRNGAGTAEIDKAWASAYANLLTRRQANLAPSATECSRQKTLSPDLVDQWSRIMLMDDLNHETVK